MVAGEDVVAGPGEDREVAVVAAGAGRRGGVVGLGHRAGARRQGVAGDGVVVDASADDVAAGHCVHLEVVVVVHAGPRAGGIGRAVGPGVAAAGLGGHVVAGHAVGSFAAAVD